MTIVSTGSSTGRIEQVSAPGSIGGFTSPDIGLGSMDGDLTRDRVESFDGDALQIISNPSLVQVLSEGTVGVTAYGFRVVLRNRDVTDRVVGGISVLQDLDRLSSAELSLHGTDLSFLATEDTWTRTPIDIFFSQGKPGKVIEELVFSGFVNKGTSQGKYVYRVTALDKGSLGSKARVCLELAPDAGRRRNDIVIDLFTTAGFLGTDFPGMSVYTKPFSVTGPVWKQALEFVEPEGLHIRVRNDGTVEGYSILLLDNPHHRWDVADMLQFSEITPPSRIESTWIFRADETISQTDIQGVVIEKTTTPILGIANAQTTSTQDANGVISERNFSGGASHSSFTFLQLIKIVETEVHKVGEQIVLKIENEFGLFNPQSARYKTVVSGPGPTGKTDFVQCFVTGEEFFVWSSARIVQTLSRIQTFLFDENGTDIGSVIQSFEYFRIREAVLTPANQDIIGILVGNDNMSYLRNGPGTSQIEGYGLRSRFDLERVYNEDTGVQVDEKQSTFGYHSIRSKVEDNFGLFDGSGQLDLVETFQLIRLEDEIVILDRSLRKTGEIKVTSQYFTRESAAGEFDWGTFDSDLEQQIFVTTNVSATSFDVISNGVFTRTVYDGTGLRNSQTFPGNPPVSRFISSAYTRYISVPVEVVINDPLVETWFGLESKVVQLQHVLNIEELNTVIIRSKSRALSFHVKVVRLETVGVIGDTVLLTDVNQGLIHRGIIISIKRVREFSNAITEYLVEVPLLVTGLKF